MKKILFFAMLISLTLVGCASGSNQSSMEDTSEVELNYGVDFTASKYKSYFDISPSEIVQRINDQAGDNFPVFYQLNDESDRLWTQNGEYWAICISVDTFKGADGEEYTRPYQAEIDFSALSSPEEAGYAIEAFISVFLPDNVDEVTYNYDIYGENTSYDSSIYNIVGQAGYLSLSSERHESLTIRADGPLLVEEEETVLPVKPE